ncbi:uncharacterized membrane protein YobD (UPF0266 family) [Bisgaardia hudsonensis]|uniref:UPF0266 membrane protein EV697_101285 n=1 Tax=Bisgaardia hudsonensis TaxID=109472 RepID=A0A4R2N2X8_9PAST|nr:DUF986 family protein [Bisgaardia hudsonensis]QLB12610.1 hypothetical protein A6A11_02815 [Bisgaardia hudsonensis]TCP14152.1 uncharacterized membrane protein YobD (UPF0266 family) [Bisgaardia hudsonensis]
MINILILSSIFLFFLYAFYDQFGMDYLKGKNKLKVRLKKRAKIDSLIFIGLIAIIFYQTKANIPTVTIYLLSMTIVLSIYIAFIRYPQILFKEKGFFYENIYITYDKIKAVNLADNHIIVIDLKNTKHLSIIPDNTQDIEKIVNFFGGYKK